MALNVIDLSALLAGTAVLLLAFALAQRSTATALDSRLKTFVRRESTPELTSVLRLQPKANQPAVVDRMNRRLRSATIGKALQADLIRAGIDMPSSRFLIIQGSAAAGTLWLTSMFVSAKTQESWLGLLVGCVAALGAWMLPKLVIGFLAGRRLKRFEDQLPVAIDAMAGALQAGSSLIQAMEMVSREMRAPMGEELSIVVREMSVGVAMIDAFSNMNERVRSLDLDMFVTAITIQHKVGGNLSQILRSISHTIRERQRIKGEIAVLTAQQRLSAIIVSGLPLLIIGALFFLAPNYIMKLFQPGIARMLLVVGAIGIGAGFYCLRKIADIDV